VINGRDREVQMNAFARGWVVASVVLVAACDGGSGIGTGEAEASLCGSTRAAITAAPAAGSSCDWPQAGRSPRRTNYNEGETVLSVATVPTLQLIWSASMSGGTASATPIQPVVWRDEVFATRKQELVSLDALTGALRWRFQPLVDVWVNVPAVGYGRVVATNVDALFGVDTDDGAELWRALPPAMDFGISAPLVAGELSYVTAHRIADPITTSVYGIRAADGARTWQYTVDGRGRARPAAASGRIYAALPDGTLVALGAGDGALLFSRPVAAGSLGSAAVASGLVLVPWASSNQHKLLAFDAASGAPAWEATVDCDLPLEASAVVDGARAYVAGSASGGGVRVIALGLATGAIDYAVNVGGGTLTGPLSGANGVLYVGAGDGHIYALDASDGRQILARDVGAPTSQSVIANGRVFVGTPDQVLALGL
jgi:outer membrane protein assembly factor BamB